MSQLFASMQSFNFVESQIIKQTDVSVPMPTNMHFVKHAILKHISDLIIAILPCMISLFPLAKELQIFSLCSQMCCIESVEKERQQQQQAVHANYAEQVSDILQKMKLCKLRTSMNNPTKTMTSKTNKHIKTDHFDRIRLLGYHVSQGSFGIQQFFSHI